MLPLSWKYLSLSNKIFLIFDIVIPTTTIFWIISSFALFHEKRDLPKSSTYLLLILTDYLVMITLLLNSFSKVYLKKSFRPLLQISVLYQYAWKNPAWRERIPAWPETFLFHTRDWTCWFLRKSGSWTHFRIEMSPSCLFVQSSVICQVTVAGDRREKLDACTCQAWIGMRHVGRTPGKCPADMWVIFHAWKALVMIHSFITLKFQNSFFVVFCWFPIGLFGWRQFSNTRFLGIEVKIVPLSDHPTCGLNFFQSLP